MHKLFYILCALAVLGSLVNPSVAYADRIDELEQEIEEKNSRIQEIEKEISGYERELNVIGGEKRTLEAAIRELDLSRAKLTSEIRLTEQEIGATVFEIEKLNLEIQSKEDNISLNNDAIAQTLRNIHEAESQTLAETFLAEDNISDFWEEIDNLGRFQIVMQADLRELIVLKKELEEKRTDLAQKEVEFTEFQGNLIGQRRAVDATKTEKDNILNITKNEEAQYQALLNEKIEQRKVFEREIAAAEAELRIAIDPGSIPPTRSGILDWPLDNIIITQYFGNTPFATENPQIYGGGGHNGIDLAASIGTPVRNALAGTVQDYGNTDLEPGCYSYGKWILVKHGNGLSTLYAHLSSISMDKGEVVNTGDIIGYSGNTGYSTGPHLHFTVFASQGVVVQKFETSINCKNVSVPISPKDGYLNPLSYLPGVS